MILGDLGGVLHQGVGGANFMLIAVKHPNGSACTYAGPVMSHYEFTQPIGTRLKDSQWEQMVTELSTWETLPISPFPPADWQKEFLAE